MNKKQKTVIMSAVGIIVLILTVLTLVIPKKDYSENENRYLSKFPRLSADSVRDGSFMSGMETYISDHFVLRDLFMTVKTGYERATGRNIVNNIYMGRDGYYIEKYDGLKNADRIEAAIRRLVEGTSADVSVCLVPTAVSVYADRLPAAAKNADQLEDLRGIVEDLSGLLTAADGSGRNVSFIDVTEALQSGGDEAVYYRLDHHWTTYGAYLAYSGIIKDFGFEPLAKTDFEREVVSSDFKGSFYSKVNDLTAKPDEITVFKSSRLKLTVNYPDKGLLTDSLYAGEYLEKKDKYSFFLNNQNSFVEIHNENAGSGRVLALVKDSYANCLVPFLAEHFETIYVFDTRYYREKVTDFINENGVTDVLFLYNMYTVDSDTGINGIY